MSGKAQSRAMSGGTGWRARTVRKVSSGLERLVLPLWRNDRVASVADKVGLTKVYRAVQRRLHPPQVRDVRIGDETFRFLIVTPEETYSGYEGEDHSESTAALQSLVARDQVVLDVGAHHGYYPLMCSRAVGPSGKVVAFEPDPSHHEVLRRNVEMNGLANVKVVQAAVGSRVGTVRFDQNRVRASSRAREVPMTTLDDVVAAHGLPRVDTIKIDVEGHELEVLKGAKRVLAMHPRILVEVHPQLLGELGQSAAEVLAYLKDQGYELSVVQGKPPRPMPYDGTPLAPDTLHQVLAQPR